MKHIKLALIVGAALALGDTASAIDVIVEYDRPPPTFGKPPEETLYQHGDQIRFDSRITDKRTGESFIHQQFTRPGQPVKFSLTRFENGGYASLTLMDDPLDAPPPKALRNYTGDQGTRLGETCRIWKAVRPVDSKTVREFLQSGCTTGDGVELWRRQASIDAIFARKVNRARISPDAVRPPIEALDLGKWANLTAAQDHTHDYLVELVSKDAYVRHRIARRSGAWASDTEEEYRDSFSHTATNEADGIMVRYWKNQDGHRQLTIDRRQRSWLNDGRVRLKNRSDEAILGERCEWWDSMPNVSDAGRNDCITPDGVILKTIYVSHGSPSMLQAVRLERSPQPITSVLPGADITSPTAWGF